MALTCAEDGPVKLGPSVADISGGMFGLFAALVLLEIRDRTGRALAIDISMQDVGAWMTHLCWNGAPLPPHTIVPCDGGEVAAAASPADTARALNGAASRAVVLASLAEAGIAAVPVQDVASAAGSPQTLARELIRHVTDGVGKSWPLLAMPYRLSALPPPSPVPIGPLGEANRRLFPAR
jgi:crotonobetainyl-CoA:carnitine CoA-transferase CaiB-like acyl-CoA transferase